MDGFLYVPDLSHSNVACQNASLAATSVNTSYTGGIPDSYPLIAVAPWFSAECVLAYMAQAGADAALALVFYLADNEILIPPAMNSAVWDLGDGGQWKSLNHYPVYAIPGAQGRNVTAALSLYSGRNLSAVPNGNLLADMYGPSALAQLFMDIVIGAYHQSWSQSTADLFSGDAPTLPSLWNFLLIVLGVLLFFVAVVSLAMHWFQRRRRNNLQRRIDSGEVDLAELGIVKRLTVPREMLDKFPLQLYNSNEKTVSRPLPPDKESRESTTDLDPVRDDEKKALEVSPLSRRSSDTTDLYASTSFSLYPPIYTLTNPSSAKPSACDGVDVPLAIRPASSAAANLSRFAQPTCAICLDDFIPSQSSIRILPCHHIFHPDCVDDFLLKTSALCPMCKTSVLPKDYCPIKVTNAMVRRERRLHIVRQARAERRRRQGEAHVSGQLPRPTENLEGSTPAGTRAQLTDRAPSPVSIPSPPVRPFHVPRFPTGRRISSAPISSTTDLPRTEDEFRHTPTVGSLQTIQDTSTPDLRAVRLQRTDSQAQAQGRREWARERALALMGHRASMAGARDTETTVGSVTELDSEEEYSHSGRVRRAFATVFPGFR